MTADSRRYGSDHLVWLLHRLGYEHIAFNPGATFRGLHDSLVNQPAAPSIVLAHHEEIAVAIAHGYAKAAGRPMAVAIHDVVGLQHAAMAIFNAFCDHVPMLMLGGSGPSDAAVRRPYIDWVHSALVQGNLVRDFVKWDDQPASLPAAFEAIVRAHRVIQTDPPGPAYVCLDPAIQEDEAPAPTTFDPGAHPLATPLAPTADAVETMATWLIEARRPVIVADHAGRDRGAVRPLIELAEHLGAPVLDLGGRFNLPSTHPLRSRIDAPEVAGADVVLALEVGELHEPLRRIGAIGPDGSLRARVASVSTRELGIRSWAAEYGRLAPVSLLVPAAPGPTLAALVAACRERPRPGDAEARTAVARERHARDRASWRATAEADAARSPIARSWLVLALGRALEGQRWALVNDSIEHPWPFRLWDFTEPEQWLGGAGGGGMGYGLGASVGAALALAPRGYLPVDIQGDGDLLYAPGAIWSAVHHRIPLLVVVLDNRAYHNSTHHAVVMAERRGRPPELAPMGTHIDDPAIDLAALARSMGASGYGPVSDPAQLEATFRRAVAEVRDGGVALVDVVSEPR